MSDPEGSGGPEVIFFAGPQEFRAWLHQHHDRATEIWTGLYKKHVADRGLTWEQAVPEALCYGWIDSIMHRIDDDTTRQRWTPRKPNSVWSTVNLAHVERLISQGRMQPAGLAAYERRRPERTGIYAFEQDLVDLPEVYAARLAAVPPAAAFWAAATASYRRLASHWVVTAAREETKERRLAQLIECCAAGRLIPPQSYGDSPRWLEAAAREASRLR